MEASDGKGPAGPLESRVSGCSCTISISRVSGGCGGGWGVGCPGRLVLAVWMVHSAESPDGCIADVLGSLEFLGSL